MLMSCADAHWILNHYYYWHCISLKYIDFWCRCSRDHKPLLFSVNYHQEGHLWKEQVTRNWIVSQVDYGSWRSNRVYIIHNIANCLNYKKKFCLLSWFTDFYYITREHNTNDIDNHLMFKEVVCPLYHVTVTIVLFLQRSCRQRYRRKWRLTTVPCWSCCDISGPVSQCPPNPWKKRLASRCKPLIMGVKVRSGNKATQFLCAFILQQLLNLHIAMSGGLGNLLCYIYFIISYIKQFQINVNLLY